MTASQVPTFILVGLATAAPEDCVCCAGGVEGAWEDLCPPCGTSIAKKTRGVGHPHPPSPAQRAIIDATGLIGGGPYWPAGDDV